MDNQLNVPKHGSVPHYSGDKDSVSSSRFSATHPSVQSRNDLLKRILSGNDPVLRRLPTRIDPNMTFSDDDEEDISSQKPEIENNAPPETDKTPKLMRPKFVQHTLPSWSAAKPLKDDFMPRLHNQPNRQHHFSAVKASKPDPYGKKRVPLTDIKAPKTSDLVLKNRDIKTTDFVRKNRVSIANSSFGKNRDDKAELFGLNRDSTAELFGKKRDSKSDPLGRSEASKSDLLLKNHSNKPDLLLKNQDSKLDLLGKNQGNKSDLLLKNQGNKSDLKNQHIKANHLEKTQGHSGRNQASKSGHLTKKSLISQPEFKVPLPAKPIYDTTYDTLVVNGKPYSVISTLGSGGSCKVFSVFDENKSLAAVKCVDLKGTDPLIREGYKKEIEYLRKLQGSNRVIKLLDFEHRENELLLVLERGEIDLASYISNEAKLKRLTPLTIKFFWNQMLEAVSEIHRHGIVHSDLKPANFLIVSGSLKLIDFGIATSVPDDMTSTFRDTQVGTLNYMSPEAITQLSTPNPNEIRFKVGVKSDVWSLGCILYNLVYGTTPFHALKTLMQKIHAITNPNHKIEFRPLPDDNLLDVLKKCLERDPKIRPSVEDLLKHPYLKTYSEEAPSSKVPADQLKSLMAQVQVLTPRRMGKLTKVVQELSGKQG